MLSKKVENYLMQNFDEILPEYQSQNREILKNLGLDSEKNAAFAEFMARFSDVYFSEKLQLQMQDVMSDELADLQGNCFTAVLVEHYGLPPNYIALSEEGCDSLLLYDSDSDAVIILENTDETPINPQNFTQKWQSFNAFLEDFVESLDTQ